MNRFFFSHINKTSPLLKKKPCIIIAVVVVVGGEVGGVSVCFMVSRENIRIKHNLCDR